MATDPRPDVARPDPHATAPVRETRLLEAVVSLVDSLLEDFDVVELVTDLTRQCAQLLDVASAGLLLAGPDGQLRLVTATSGRTAELELFQLQTHEGPCLECYRTGRQLSVADLRTAARRWPGFVEAARRQGFASVHAIPMRAAGTVIGALGLFGVTPGELNPLDLAVGQTLAHVATVAILQQHGPAPETVSIRLRDVLRQQVLVEQAKGLVHDALRVPLDEAATLLRAYARRHHRHLTDVCETLVSDRGQRPMLLAGLRSVRAELAS